jgi:ubiquinone/menaquinone biosynthesis C-methylase UbiE
MAKTQAFDQFYDEYEHWFSINEYVFQSELKALKKALTVKENAIEVGMGSGIFAAPLGIKEGVEPSESMRNLAKEKGLEPINGIAEDLPYVDNSKNAVLMVTTICFVDDIYKSFREVHRVLIDDGLFVIGFVDKNSPIGKSYLQEKDKSLFYKEARFFGTEQLYGILEDAGFEIIDTFQTIFGRLDEIVSEQKTLAGSGQGSFIVIKAQKKNV